MEQLYSELRRMAGSFMRRERGDHTLQPTALANEVFLCVGGDTGQWDSTGHYFGAAAQAMRRILIQHSRSRRAHKRGGAAPHVRLEDVQVPAQALSRAVLNLEDALTGLARHDAGLAQLVHQRYFAGLTLEEIAAETGRSLSSVKRDWNYARAWLFDYLT